MTVVFEGSALWRDPITGVGRAFLTTLRSYLVLAERPPVLLWPGDLDEVDERLGPLPGLRVVAAPGSAAGKQLRLPRILRSLRARVLHSPVAAVPLRARCPVIATVHDLPWMAPDPGVDGNSLGRRVLTRLYLRRADAVLVPSPATAVDVAGFAGERVAAKLQIVPHAVTPPPEVPAEIAGPGPLLVLGDDRPRKNRARVMAAHHRAQAERSDLPPLRFVGPPGAWLDETEKWQVLRSSRALVHCSLWEGFGLPVLEAFAAGTPVVCSNRGALAELGGGAALLVDPADERAIAEALVRIHADAPLRERLREAGLQRAARFSADAGARAWLQLHGELSR